MKTLVVGYGNSLCSDDGAGIEVAEKLDLEHIAGVEIRTAHQLHIEMISEWADYDRVILVDAAETGQEVQIKKMESGLRENLVSSHHAKPEFLAQLQETLQGNMPEMYVCSVPGTNFGIGDQLTDACRGRVGQAVEQIKKLLES